MSLLLLGKDRNLLNLALTKKRCRTHRSHAEGARRHDVDADRFGQAFRLLHASLRGASRCLAGKLGNRNDCALTPGDVGFAVTVIIVQDLASSSPLSLAPRFSVCADCSVEIACL